MPSHAGETPTTEEVLQEWRYNYPDYDNEEAALLRWLAERIEEATTEKTAQLNAVKALHTPRYYSEDDVECSTCLSDRGGHLTYPCPTIQVIEEAS